MNLGNKIRNGFTQLGQKLKSTFSPQLGQKVASAIKSTAQDVSKYAGDAQNTLNDFAQNDYVKSIDKAGIVSGLASGAGVVKNVANIANAGTNAIEKFVSGDGKGAGQDVQYVGDQLDELKNNATNVGATALKLAPLFI